MDLIDAQGIKCGTDAGEIRFHKSYPIGEGSEPFLAGGQCRIIPIQADQPTALRQPPCYLEGVSAAAGRAIHIHTAALRLEDLHTFGSQNRYMSKFHM